MPRPPELSLEGPQDVHRCVGGKEVSGGAARGVDEADERTWTWRVTLKAL